MIEIERTTARAGVILSLPDAWIEADGRGGYLVRPSPDRRRRAALRLCEAGFAALSRDPGLSVRPEGGWRLVRAVRPAPPPVAGRPSIVEGARTCVGPDGGVVRRTVNLGESPIAWLARRRDANGEPWLRSVEVVAAEKLRDDFTLAGTVGRLTMAWDAGPKTKGGRGPGVDPVERARAAKARIARALDDVGPELREVLVKICFAGTALEAAERDLGLPRRAGKTILKLALARLARHYGLS